MHRRQASRRSEILGAADALSSILESTSEPVVVVDSSATPLLANTAYDQLLVAAGGALTLFDPAGAAVPPEAMPLRRAARGESAHIELTVVRPDGGHHPYQVTIRPTRLPGATDAVGIVTFRDLAERRLRLIQERFLALVAHELRAPLSAIQGHAELLTSYIHGESLPPEVRGIAQRVYRLAERLDLMLEDLLDVARIANGKLRIRRESIDLRDVVTSAVEIVRAHPQAPAFHVDLPDASIVVDGDAVRLGDVVLNLLTNAIKHAASTPHVNVRLSSTPGWAEIEVEDFGPGIPPQHLALIFTRHHQVLRDDLELAATSGLGLGLYIAQETVAAHGGRIGVESTPGIGTCFTIRVPRGECTQELADHP
jgi:two-component system CheB/CheR fusion protein